MQGNVAANAHMHFYVEIVDTYFQTRSLQWLCETTTVEILQAF